MQASILRKRCYFYKRWDAIGAEWYPMYSGDGGKTWVLDAERAWETARNQ